VRRLYLQIYFTVIATLVVLVVIAAVGWRVAMDTRFDQTSEIVGELASAALPAAGEPAERQQAALEALHRRIGADLALYAADGSPIAAAGERLPAINPERRRGGWLRGPGGRAWALRLGDGRWLAARFGQGRRHPGWIFATFLGLVALAVGLCALPVVRWITRRVERLQAGVERLGLGDLGARVPVEGKDEVAALAHSFNRAAARIQELVGSQKMLLANCSHELRTPLARIRIGLELAGGDPQRRDQLQRDIAELDGLIDEILLTSRLDALPTPERHEEVDLLALAAEEAARYEISVEGKPVLVRGDPALLRRMIRNLLENARRHGGGSPVEVTVAPDHGAVLSVSDRGCGVAVADREKIFEPFYRASPASEASPGSGLGLALVRQIARRHGGDAQCLGREGGGSTFRVVLPAV
jgi:signal transduction histidine kinase